jgi:predicted metal-dependent phosphoesterase TrpH
LKTWPDRSRPADETISATSAPNYDATTIAMNADLHCHSTVSDGTLEPEAVASRAKANGVELWALTDHDEIDGQQRARDAALAIGLSYLTGTEISVTFAGVTVHVVGLGFDANDERLAAGLKATRGGRESRAHEMSDELAKVGIDGAYEGALRFVGNPDLISRTHFARFLVECGACASTQEVFRRFLVEGKPGFVPHRWATLRDAVSWIADAGGIAVIAHPARYKFTPTEEYALFTEFKALGGRGVEVVTGAHSAADAARYADAAREFDLLASRGSDFHSPEESRIDLGGLPPLPAGLAPVWEALEARIHLAA